MEQQAKVGVFFCTCQGDISDKVDLDPIIDETKKLPQVVCVRKSHNMCAFLEGELMAREINRYRLNRLVMAGCSEAEREKFFNGVLEKSGLDRSMLVMVNIREECSRVSVQRSDAVEKVRKLIRVGINQAENLELYSGKSYKVNRTVLIIGGGVAGIEAALKTAARGFKVILVERENNLGGIFAKVNFISGLEKRPLDLIREKISSIRADENIELLTATSLVDVDGSVGNFTVYLSSEGKEISRKVGAIIAATGMQTIFCPVKYGLGVADNVFGLLKLEQMLAQGMKLNKQVISFIVGRTSENSNIPMVAALKNALLLKKNMDMTVNLFYNNIKVAGDNWEAMYAEARDAGINFFKTEKKLNVELNDGKACIIYEDPFLKRIVHGEYKVSSDYIVFPDELAPAEGTEGLARILRIGMGPAAFLGSDNVHLNPGLTSREGVYLAGSCQSPMMYTDIVLQARTLAGEILKKFGTSGEINLETYQPRINAEKCTVCLTCLRCCPHHAMTIQHGQYGNLYGSAAQVNPLACKGCGMCAAECPGKAIEMPGYSDGHIFSQLDILEE